MSKEPLEHREQAALIKWANAHKYEYQHIESLFSIANDNAHGVEQGAMRKLTGVKSGVPDLFLPVPKGVYHGLFIELKRRNNKGRASDKQKAWIDYLNFIGYKAVVCHGAKEATLAIKDYYDN